MGVAARVWLTLFFGVGTTFWYEATLGSSWDFSLLVTVPFTLAALGEVFGEARPWAVGVLAAVPALARYDMALAWPCYAGLLWVREKRTRELLAMLPSMVVVAALLVAFNEARFGTPYDIARWLWYSQDKYRFARPGGPLALRHFPFNLYTLLFMAPSYSDKFPYIHPEFLGQALMLTSPAFVLALRPSFLRPIAALVALAAALCTGPIMLWYANGFAQLGTRFYVEIYPFRIDADRARSAAQARSVDENSDRGVDRLRRVLHLASAMVRLGRVVRYRFPRVILFLGFVSIFIIFSGGRCGQRAIRLFLLRSS